MSRHRMYQNYDYEEDLDEFDGGSFAEEEEDELSPEDRAQMTAGTEEIKGVLGPQASKVTTQQIQEALWHYYYDIDKTVAFLISKFIDPAPKPAAKSKPQKNTPPAPNGMPFLDSLLSVDLPLPTGASEADLWRVCATKPRPRQSCASFFADMPWMNIPEDRRTVFIRPQRTLGGGLLGGSSAPPKMSKLQALAAARKRKAEEKKSETSQEETASKDPTQTEAVERGVARMKIARLEAEPSPSPATPSTNTDTASPLPSTVDGAFESRDEPITPQPPVPKAEPSAFAQALLHNDSASKAPSRLYPPPWMAYTTPDALSEAFSKPSPDDVVLAAQSKAGKKSTSATPNAKNKESTEAALKNLKIAETPLPKSKGLNVLKEYENSKLKKHASFVVVGHVDSGKSTMTGRMLLDLGVVNQRTIDKHRKEAEKIGKASFSLAWVLDTREEEREHGVTIDIATNNFETDKTLFTILDAPGHKDYVPNMLAGASQADFAVLVIDAAKGAFEAGLKGQTREHALLLRSMGVFRLIVAINKLDTADWDKERFEEIKDQIMGSLKVLKFRDRDISFVPVSGLTGDNIVRRSKDPNASWYTGPTLIEELESSEPVTRPLDKPLRMTIADLWDTRLSPITVSGRIDAGTVQVGDALLVQPSGEKAYVKALEMNQDPVDWAVAGQHIVMYLSHIDEDHIRAGDVICQPSNPIPCVDTFTMKALAFDTFFPMPVEIHKGRLHVAGKVSQLRAVLDLHTGAITKKKPQVVKAGSVARIRMKTDEKVPLEVGERVVIRYNGDTVAAGLLEESQ
ncbi:HBS1-like protein [Cytospora mali]|uniref:Elongation factor 1 alpha-like protein n=1 Tax=Cytospora mali TaxID=578113 RepID=A0A194VZJ7_CYTMA|nr:HBS1-like protein [Valsa mali]